MTRFRSLAIAIDALALSAGAAFAFAALPDAASDGLERATEVSGKTVPARPAEPAGPPGRGAACRLARDRDHPGRRRRGSCPTPPSMVSTCPPSPRRMIRRPIPTVALTCPRRPARTAARRSRRNTSPPMPGHQQTQASRRPLVDRKVPASQKVPVSLRTPASRMIRGPQQVPASPRARRSGLPPDERPNAPGLAFRRETEARISLRGVGPSVWGTEPSGSVVGPQTCRLRQSPGVPASGGRTLSPASDQGRTRCSRCAAIQSQPACQYAEPRSRPSSAALASHAAIQASAVSSVTPSPMRRLRVAARRASSMRSGVDRRDMRVSLGQRLSPRLSRPRLRSRTRAIPASPPPVSSSGPTGSRTASLPRDVRLPRAGDGEAVAACARRYAGPW